jgi:hypothetical protein
MDGEGGSFLAVGCYTIYIMAVMVGGRYGGWSGLQRHPKKIKKSPINV